MISFIGYLIKIGIFLVALYVLWFALFAVYMVNSGVPVHSDMSMSAIYSVFF